MCGDDRCGDRRPRWRARVCGLAGLLLAATPPPSHAVLSADSTPYGSVLIGDVVYFTADDGVHGRELWRTDGSSAGTQLVKDLDPGPASSEPCALTDVGGTLYFGANDSTTSEYVLWRSDGSAGGTIPLARYPLSGGSCLSNVDGYRGPQGFARFGDRIFFSAADTDHGNELWSTDGTPAGTALFRDINPGGEGAGTDSSPRSLLVFNGALYFLAFDDLWRSDGTPQGTALVRNDDPDDSWRPHVESDLHSVGNNLLFVADFTRLGDELWSTDGSAAGTHLLKDTAAGRTGGLAESLYDRRFAQIGAALFFFSITNDDVGFSFQAWRSDGTAAGTVALAHPVDGRPPRAFAVLNDTLYFAAPRFQGPGGLWKAGSTEVESVATLSDQFGADIGGLVASDGRLFLQAHDMNTCALWVSDGTSAGTALVRPDTGCFGGPGDEAVMWLQPYPGGVLFGARDPLKGYELFRSDGTAAGTVLVADINQTSIVCAGDCDGCGSVSVAELLRGVNIALGNGAVSLCPVADVDGDGNVIISELIAAVNRALAGC